MQKKSIVILTGAGISAESGLATFRATDGLWCEHRIEDVATPEGYARDADLVHRFYNTRRAQLKDVVPNAAHLALARLAAEWDGDLCLVTQNVDDLHARATHGVATRNGYQLVPMHGELKKVRCTECDTIHTWEDALSRETICPSCGAIGHMRPHIVWFGEMPLFMDTIERALASADLFLSIGTSGNVYPAAGFVQSARMYGRAHTVELNLEPSAGRSLFHEAIHGPATQIVPAYVERILA